MASKKKTDDPVACMLCGCLPLNRAGMHKINACRNNGSGLNASVCDTCLAHSIGDSVYEIKSNLLRLRGWLEDISRLASNLPPGYMEVVRKRLDGGDILGCIEYLKKAAKRL